MECRAGRPILLAGVVSVIVGCAAVGTHPDDLGDTCAAERASLRGAQDYAVAVLLFLAGHGVVHAGRYHFLPHEVAGATLEAVTASGLGQTELAERIGAHRPTPSARPGSSPAATSSS